MAEIRRCLPNQELDLEQILQEAKNRWLRPVEIFEILRNYQKFHLTPDPPCRPPAGSLFLFDRKALRYFRKDGHRWRKKKDGKTVREAHEKLKAGSVDVLHCYYAHGEDNESFQRRSYWMLDRQLEHIVLVHYREVKEGYKSSISRLLNSDPVTDTESPQVSSAPSSAIANSAACIYASSPTTSHWTGQTLSSEFDEGDSGDNCGSCSLAQPIYGSLHEDAGFPGLFRTPEDSDYAGSNFTHDTSSSLWPQFHSSSRNVNTTFKKEPYFGQLTGADAITHKLVDAQLDSARTVQDVLACGSKLIPGKDIQVVVAAPQGAIEVPREHDFNILHPKSPSDCPQPLASDYQVENTCQESGNNHDESVELKKLDSFGRWMDKEIGADCDDSLMASDSGNYWNTLDTQNDEKEVSSLSHQMQLDVDSLGPSLSKEQLFSICDFSPDWAYSGVETKVLVIGTFLENAEHSVATKWCCMFGEIEVAAEVLTCNTFRCHAPTHALGRVPFYITCSNRLACSEVREFEYRAKPSQDAFSTAVAKAYEDELRLQIRLAKILCLDLERKWLDCSSEDCEKCSKLKKHALATKINKKDDWQQFEASSLVVAANRRNPRDVLIENLLKDRLSEWLICKLHEGGKGPNIWDEGGQGVIHLAASLGYEWAMGPIVAAGVSPNFRDACGRTSLHWASFFGREEVVLALVRLGADSGAVDDPKPAFPGGQTAADLASSRGHKGIAGYLAETHLTSRLISLTVKEKSVVNIAGTTTEKNDTESTERLFVPSDDKMVEQLSLKGSLVAVQKSARAAALIQAAFRSHSFRYRQLTKSSDEISEVSLDLVALGSLNKVHKMCHFSEYLHSAAIKIQQNYRGWKRREEFLKIRKRIVKIQSHVRGHQVRKQYKKVVWSVSIVEKVILRWRRKRVGLRNFRQAKAVGNVSHETENEYDFLQIGRKQKSAGVENALARVKSMARHPEARDQYMRLVTKFENLEMSDGAASASKQADITENNKAVQD